MRNIVISLVLFTYPCVAQSDNNRELVPLERFISQNSSAMSDPPTLQYLTIRCSGLYAAIQKAFDGETDPDRVDMQNTFKAKSEKYLRLAFDIELRNKTPKTDDNIKEIPRQVVSLANIYVDRMKNARLRFGSFFEDKIVKGDYDICEGMSKD
jgi:hypothetical protein